MQILKKQWLLIVLLAAGVLLIVLPQLVSLSGGKEKESADSDDGTGEYAAQLESSLEGLISSLSGVRSCTVMLTLDGGDETVYAEDESASEQSSTKSHVVLSGGDGEAALAERKLTPAVRGVACVCRGAGGAALRSEITSLICCSLGIQSNRVFVSLEE